MQVYPWLVGETFVVFLVRIGVPIYPLLPQSTLTYCNKTPTPHSYIEPELRMFLLPCGH